MSKIEKETLEKALGETDDGILDAVIREKLESREKMKKSSIKRLRVRVIAIAAAVLIAVSAAIPLVLWMHQTTTPAATVCIDINPSVEIKVSSKKEVLSLYGVNADGKNLLSEIDVVGKQIDDAVTDIVLLTIEKGYLTEKHNAVLLTVSSENEALAKELCDSLDGTVSDVVKMNVPGGEVKTRIAEDYFILLSQPALNKVFPYDPYSSTPRLEWTSLMDQPIAYAIEIDYLHDGSYMTIEVKEPMRKNSFYSLSREQWDTIVRDAPTVNGIKRIAWRIRIDREKNGKEEPYRSGWGYFNVKADI